MKKKITLSDLALSFCHAGGVLDFIENWSIDEKIRALRYVVIERESNLEIAKTGEFRQKGESDEDYSWGVNELEKSVTILRAHLKAYEAYVNLRKKDDADPTADPADVGFSEDVISGVYDRCNDKLWTNTKKEDLATMLKTGNITVEIKSGNKQRVFALFNRLGKTTNDTEWIKNVEGSLGIRLNKILKLDDTNSYPNKEFNSFLDKIHET